MKHFLTLILALSSLLVYTQQSSLKNVPAGQRNTAPLTLQDAIALSSIEELSLPPEYKNRSLPDSIDNSVHEWFRPIFSQVIYPNCMQSTSIAYNFTYEINRLRGLPSDTDENLYTTHFAWNFFNGGNGWFGANYLFTMDVLKYHGTPTIADYGGIYNGGGERWMSGYEEWQNAMNNRITDIKQIYVGDENGLLTLKHWLNDHLDGSETGGVASFIACSPYNLDHLPAGTPNAGRYVVTEFCEQASHGMTIVGYNDSIRYDYNEDGEYTNNIDLNGDGRISMSDWEIGGVKMANSHGLQFADSGFAYIMYKSLADHISEGGIWANRVHVLFAKESHDTRMSCKIALEHDYRERIRVRTGISTDVSANKPEYIRDYTIFNYQGGWHYMQGNDTTPDHKTIEFALDVTPLLSHVEAGSPFKIFLIVDENDKENLGTGQVKYFSVVDHQQGDEEYVCDQQNVPLMENGTTLLSVTLPSYQQGIEITTQELPVYEAGVPFDLQLEATGGQEPYTWMIDRNYQMSQDITDFPLIDNELLLDNSLEDSLALKKLDFSFPFYGNYYDSVVVSSSGYLQFDENMFFWSYLVDYPYFLRNNRVIAPLLSQDMIVYENADDGVWYEGDETKASFRWKTTFLGEVGESELNFAVNLYPNGDIEFYYGNMMLQDNMRHVMGISDGDLLNNSLPHLPEPRDLVPGTKIAFLNPSDHAEIELSDDGLLSISQDASQTISDVNVMVTDQTLLSDYKTYQLTDGLEINLSVAEGSSSNIPNGRLTSMDLSVSNRSNASINDVNVSLSCDHPMLTISNDYLSLGSLQAGQSVNIADAFACMADINIPDHELITLHLTCDGIEKSYDKDYFFFSSCPDVVLHDYQIDKPNGIFEPGENTDLEISVINKGSFKSVNTQAQLFCDYPGVSIIDSLPVAIGNIQAGEYQTFRITLFADYSIPYGTRVDLMLRLTDEFGSIKETPMSIRVGKTPVLIVDMDPTQNSGPMIASFLESMDIEAEYVQSFPGTMNNYQSVMLCLGIQFSYHEISYNHSQVLVDYLESGGSLYMEGRIVWQQDDQWDIFDMFNIETIPGPALYEKLVGVDSTFTEGLAYTNSASQPVCFYYLDPVPPAFSILTGVEYPNCAAVANDGGSYKTIGTIFELGALISSDTCQVDQYIREVLDFFGVMQSTLDIEEIAPDQDFPVLQNYPNPFSSETKIPLKLEERSFVEAAVYDLSGRKVSVLKRASHMDRGNYLITWNGKSDSGKEVPGGIYIYHVLINGVPSTGKMVLVK